MRNIVILAAFMVGLSTIMAQVADRMTLAPARANSPSLKVAAVEPSTQTAGRSLSIPRDARGHFQTEGRIDGQRIGFMVDTGASVVALNESSAARFGLRPSSGDYNATVTTANGKSGRRARGSPLVEIGGLVVRDVDAMVLPDEALSEKPARPVVPVELKRFEYANGKMVLEQ
jgi:aspartyl protease family protein